MSFSKTNAVLAQSYESSTYRMRIIPMPHLCVDILPILHIVDFYRCITVL